MNVVQVNLFEDMMKKRYTYKVPDGISLRRGYIVRVKNRDGRELPAVCISDSENLSDNAVEMIMGGTKVTSDVIGMYSYVDFKLIDVIAEKAI